MEFTLKDVDEYYEEIRGFINQTNKAVAAAKIMGVSLFDWKDVAADLRQTLTKVGEVGRKVGVDNTVALRNSDALLSELSRSPERCRFYKDLVTRRLRHETRVEPEPPSLKELEERFQFRCFKGRRIKAGLGMGTKSFETWKRSEDYTGTFYDEL